MGNPSILDRIFRQLYFQRSQSCAELSQRLRKSIPLVSQALNRLIEIDAVVASGYAPSTGGRRAMRYALNGSFGHVVAVSMDQLFTTVQVVDLSDRPITEPETFELDLFQHQQALAVLADRIAQHLSAASLSYKLILGVGIAMPGFINHDKGINHTFFEQDTAVSHQAFLKDRLQLPVFLDNDSSLTALAEWTFGRAKGANNAMIINLGWGTGLGMVVNGELFRGETGFAGEFSHIPISDNGILCECGKRGCLETETSLLIMAQKARKSIKEGGQTGIPDTDEKYLSDLIIDAAARGNQLGINLISQMGFALGKGIAILIHIMNPGLIVLSGRGARAEKILMAPIQQALNEYCIPRLAAHTDIILSELCQQAPLIGAAALVIENTSVSSLFAEKDGLAQPL